MTARQFLAVLGGLFIGGTVGVILVAAWLKLVTFILEFLGLEL